MKLKANEEIFSDIQPVDKAAHVEHCKGGKVFDGKLFAKVTGDGRIPQKLALLTRSAVEWR